MGLGCLPVSPPHSRLKADNPAIEHLLRQPALGASELAMRLFYFYLAQDRPLLDDRDLAELAASEAAAAGLEAAAGQDQQAAGEGVARGGRDEAVGETGGGGVAAVGPDLKNELARFRDLTCLSYTHSSGLSGCQGNNDVDVAGCGSPLGLLPAGLVAASEPTPSARCCHLPQTSLWRQPCPHAACRCSASHSLPTFPAAAPPIFLPGGALGECG